MWNTGKWEKNDKLGNKTLTSCDYISLIALQLISMKPICDFLQYFDFISICLSSVYYSTIISFFELFFVLKFCFIRFFNLDENGKYWNFYYFQLPYLFNPASGITQNPWCNSLLCNPCNYFRPSLKIHQFQQWTFFNFPKLEVTMYNQIEIENRQSDDKRSIQLELYCRKKGRKALNPNAQWNSRKEKT